MNKKRKASNYERELLSKFHDLGFNGVRVAGSGSSQFPSPDLLVGRKGLIYAVEVKTSEKEFLHISKKQLSELLGFCNNLNILPLVGVKFLNRADWFFLPAEDLLKSNDNLHVRINETDRDKGFFLDNLN